MYIFSKYFLCSDLLYLFHCVYFVDEVMNLLMHSLTIVSLHLFSNELYYLPQAFVFYFAFSLIKAM